MSFESTCVEKIKEFSTGLEKKKRNLEKRKNKLDEYKSKKDLSKDQQEAVSKYNEVISNVILLEELIKSTIQCQLEMEKCAKKSQKSELNEKKKLLSSAFQTQCTLEKISRTSSQTRDNLVESAQISREEMDDIFSKSELVVKNNSAGNFKEVSDQILSIIDSREKDYKFLSSINWDEAIVDSEQAAINVPSLPDVSNEEQVEDKIVDEKNDTELVDSMRNLDVDRGQTPASTNGHFEEMNNVSEKEQNTQAAVSGFNFLHSSTIAPSKHSVDARVDGDRPNNNQVDNGGWNQVRSHPRHNNQVTNNDGDVFDSASNSDFLQHNARQNNRDGVNNYNYRGGQRGGRENGGFRGGRGQGGRGSGNRGNRGAGGFQGRGAGGRGGGNFRSGYGGNYNNNYPRNNRQQQAASDM